MFYDELRISLGLSNHLVIAAFNFFLFSTLRDSHLLCGLQQVSMGTGTQEIVAHNQST